MKKERKKLFYKLKSGALIAILRKASFEDLRMRLKLKLPTRGRKEGQKRSGGKRRESAEQA